MSWKQEFYPSRAEVDRWCAGLLDEASGVSAQGTLLDQTPVREPFGNCPNTLVNRYVRFTASDGRRPFYGSCHRDGVFVGFPCNTPRGCDVRCVHPFPRPPRCPHLYQRRQ